MWDSCGFTRVCEEEPGMQDRPLGRGVVKRGVGGHAGVASVLVDAPDSRYGSTRLVIRAAMAAFPRLECCWVPCK